MCNMNSAESLSDRLTTFLGYTPTDEQLTAVEAALRGGNLVMTAGAGTGKSTTLKMIGFALAPKRCLYITFNKSVQKAAAASFPPNVQCRTAHSLAFRDVPAHGKRSRNSPRMSGRQLAYALNIEHGFQIGNDRELAPARLASLVMETVERFCKSADRTITPRHAPVVDGAEEVSWELSAFLAEYAQRAWDTDLSQERGTLPTSGAVYIKVWALRNPALPAQVILYDEAQDANPCVAGVVLAQRNKQLIAVGDESQAINGWMGAVDAMANWPADERVALQLSFRFGQAVADEANKFLTRLNAPLRIKGVGPASVVEDFDMIEADAILCRTNAKSIEVALNLHEARRFAIMGGTTPIRKFAEAAADLMVGRKAGWHADLGAFKSWDDVLDYVNNDHGGSDLRALVNMVTDYGTETLIDIANKAVDAEHGNPEVIISTAHKAKGAEWDAVYIADDFQPPVDPETGERREPGRAELMLMYVAVTRAKKRLNASTLAWAK